MADLQNTVQAAIVSSENGGKCRHHGSTEEPLRHESHDRGSSGRGACAAARLNAAALAGDSWVDQGAGIVIGLGSSPHLNGALELRQRGSVNLLVFTRTAMQVCGRGRKYLLYEPRLDFVGK